MLSSKTKKLIRVKASTQAVDGTYSTTHKRFCIDPEITSFEMLRTMLAKLFGLKSEFTVFYVTSDPMRGGALMLQSLLNDWDLDAALVSSAKPYLRLVAQVKPLDDGLEDWDVVTSLDVTEAHTQQQENRTTGGFLESIGKALGGLRPRRSGSKLAKAPMTEAEFRNYLDSDGRLANPVEFRASVYKGGIDPLLRRTAWPHLLCVYPEEMTSTERVDYLRRKSEEYAKLRDEWLEKVKAGVAGDEVRFVTTMVKKDVVRTDRTHPFYAGGDDDNCHVVGLFHVLVTYAVYHPESSYCQGMSDLASPLFVVLHGDEALTYICFCSLMRRLRSNFSLDGRAMTAKFEHLGLLLQRCDDAFYDYLRENEADDLFFTYRWLLLELKREFPLDDALLMLEVMWSTLQPDPPIAELPLVDPPRRSSNFQHHPSASSLLVSPSAVQPQQTVTGGGGAGGGVNCTPPTIAGSLSSSASGYSRLRLSRRSSSGRFICSPPPSSSMFVQPSDSLTAAPVAAAAATSGVPSAIESSGEFSVPDDDECDEADDGAADCRSERDREDDADAFGGGACDGVSTEDIIDECLIAQVARTAEQIDQSLVSQGGCDRRHRDGDVRRHSPNACDSLADFFCAAKTCDTHVERRDADVASAPSETYGSQPQRCELVESPAVPVGNGAAKAFSMPNLKTVAECTSDCVDGAQQRCRPGSSLFKPIDDRADLENGAYDFEPPFACGQSVFYVPAGSTCGCQSHFYVNLPVSCVSSPDVAMRPTLAGHAPHQQPPDEAKWRHAAIDEVSTVTSKACRQCVEGEQQPQQPQQHPRSRQPSGGNASVDGSDRMSQVSVDSGIRSHPSTPPFAALVRRQSFMLENLGEHQLRGLPPPCEFGCGNPFLVCAAATLILLHRDQIMSSHMDFNDIVLLFDKMVRKNDVHRVIAKSQALYAEYLKEQDFEDSDGDFSFSFSM